MIRMVRFIRLVRIVKVTHFINGFGTVSDDNQEQGDDDDKNLEDRPSKIGQRLAEGVSRKVVLLIMVIILFTPLLADDEVELTRFSYVAGLDRVTSPPALRETAAYVVEKDTNIVFLQSRGTIFLDKRNFSNITALRSTEIATYGEGCNDLTLCPVIINDTVAKYATRNILVEQALYNLGLTL